MSSARQSDEFVVREQFAEDRPRVVVVADRRPSMRLYPRELPWLHKPSAVATAGRMIVESAVAAHGFPGYLDLADARTPRWLPPTRRQHADRIRRHELERAVYTAREDSLLLAFRHLERARLDVRAGSFVFVLSDFLAPPPASAWRAAESHGWDVVPVVLQDPLWEQSFPNVAGLLLPLPEPVRLTRREVAVRRAANERRRAELLDGFAGLELDPVLLSTEEPVEIFAAFMRWHERRRRRLSVR